MTSLEVMHRRLVAVVIAAAVITLLGVIALWPHGDRPDISKALGPKAELVRGRVELLEVKACEGTRAADRVTCTVASVKLDSGPDKGTVVIVENPTGPGTPVIHEGDRLVLGYSDDAELGQQYYFSDFERRAPLVLLGALFAIAVCVLGRWRGVRALGGLAITFVILTAFVLPAILEGENPVVVALFGAAAALLINLYLAHGFEVRTTTAVLGTLASLGLIALLAAVFVSLTHLTGLADEEASYLQALSSSIDLRGLLLGGIIIGSLGVLDDVTVTQASSVWELHETNPELGGRELYRRALNIGRDHIASVVNTLVLAYAGASLPLLVLFVEANRGLGDVLTGETVAAEIVRTLVGSIGLVASVPMTTALAASVASRDRGALNRSE